MCISFLMFLCSDTLCFVRLQCSMGMGRGSSLFPPWVNEGSISNLFLHLQVHWMNTLLFYIPYDEIFPYCISKLRLYLFITFWFTQLSVQYRSNAHAHYNILHSGNSSRIEWNIIAQAKQLCVNCQIKEIFKSQ